jgi:BirA family biotin operon repressor/biotin-[acetyl-CoA-carboxylase] ligase
MGRNCQYLQKYFLRQPVTIFSPLWYYLFVAKDISPSTITQGLDTSIIGRKVLYYPTLNSTMDTARHEAQQGAPDGTVIIAGQQTGGRGRLRRDWLSPPGNIALSIILHPDLAGLPYLVMIASLAAAYSIESVTGLKAQIKWPNDILIDGKKVGGILIENEMKGDKISFSIIGIGINTNLDITSYPEIAATAASLITKNMKDDLRIKIIRALLTEFEKLYLKLPDDRPIFETWRERLVTLGKQVKATSGSQIIAGIAESVDETGALLIHQSDGTLTRIIAGDVTLREK